MTGPLLIIAVGLLVLAVVVIVKKSQFKEDTSRAAQLITLAKRHNPDVSLLEALDHLYVEVYSEMLLARKFGQPYDEVFHDSVIIWNLRNEEIQREVEEYSNIESVQKIIKGATQ